MDKEMILFCLILAAMSGPVFTEDWKANVVKQLDALVTSCVVVPCSFSHPKEDLPTSRLRGIWHRSTDRNARIYYQDQTQILENFRGRTRLLGHLGQDNCTLEITEIRDHDNGPFCFRIELARTETDVSTVDKFSFVEDCVTLRMLPDPPKPILTHSKTAFQGRPYTVTCSITHTCPSFVPVLTWSRVTPDVEVTEAHREVRFGYWEAQSVLTIIPGEKDDHSEITCTAQFNGRRTSSTTLSLYVKRTENYNHIIIPTAVAVGTAVIFTVFCIFMVKRYKKRIAELQSRHGSIWNRLSRLSRRTPSGGSEPSRSDQRSIWSRFSQRPQRDAVDLDHMPKHSNSCADQKVFKARFPSPKSQPKSNYKENFDGGNDCVDNVYGNI